MAQALYRKWRPQNWSDVVGQDHVIQTLRNAIQGDRMVHAYLFAGPRGTGKTSTARLLAKAINCLDEDIRQRPCNHCQNCEAVNQGRFLDLIEIDAASNTSVDDVRDLRDKINFSPSQGSHKVYIIDEVHMLSTAAFNALLKTLEEPPSHAIFVLATTEIHKIPATVLSRCQRHEFRRISVSDIVEQLEQIISDEKLDIEPAVLTLIARQSTGAMRDAISLLDQLSSSGEAITLEYAHQILGTATNQAVIAVVDAILDGQTSAGLEQIHSTLDSGTDPRQFARQIVEYLRSLLLEQMGNAVGADIPAEVQAQIKQHAASFDRNHLLFSLQRFNNTASDTRSNWQPNLPLEMALAECVGYQPPSEPAGGPAAMREFTREPAPPSPKTAPAPKLSPPETTQPIRQTAQDPAGLESGPAQSPTAVKGKKQAEPQSIDSAGKVSLRSVRQHWDTIRQRVKSENPMVEALLNSCSYIAVKNGELILGFASEVVKSKMDTNANLSLVTPIITKILGTEVTIRCMVMDKKGKGSMDTDLDADGMVNAALGLGGQIIQQE